MEYCHHFWTPFFISFLLPSLLPLHRQSQGSAVLRAIAWPSVTLCLPWKLFTTIFPFVGHFQALASFHCMTQLSNETPNILNTLEQPKIPHRRQSFTVQKVTGDPDPPVPWHCVSWWGASQLLYTCENRGPWTILSWHWGKKLKTWSPQTKNWASEYLYGALISSLGAEHFVSGCTLRHFNIPCTVSHLFECASVLERW